MTDSPIGDAEGRLREFAERLRTDGEASYPGGLIEDDLLQLFARLETAERENKDLNEGWAITAGALEAGSESLRAQVATLTRERDEARATVEALHESAAILEDRAAHAEASSSQAHHEAERMRRNRGAVIARVEKAEAERDRLTALIRDTAIPALAMDTFEQVFNQHRFAEDTDTDYFLRCFRALRDRASQAHAKLSAEVGG